MQCACALFYCHLWHVLFDHIFPHYLINCRIFGKKLLNIKCVFWFSLQLLSEKFVIPRRTERDKVYVSIIRVQYNSHFLAGFRKILKHRISWKYIQRELTLFHADRQTDGQADIHEKANNSFSQNHRQVQKEHRRNSYNNFSNVSYFDVKEVLMAVN